MIKLRKFAYKFWLPILLCIGCVFIQSQSELALPDYMSKIVTNGIQAGGFDSPVADVFSDETFKHLLVFADDEQKKTIESSYTYTSYENLKDNFKEEYSKFVSKSNSLVTDLAINLSDGNTAEVLENFRQLRNNLHYLESFSNIPMETISMKKYIDAYPAGKQSGSGSGDIVLGFNKSDTQFNLILNLEKL